MSEKLYQVDSAVILILQIRNHRLQEVNDLFKIIARKQKGRIQTRAGFKPRQSGSMLHCSAHFITKFLLKTPFVHILVMFLREKGYEYIKALAIYCQFVLHREHFKVQYHHWWKCQFQCFLQKLDIITVKYYANLVGANAILLFSFFCFFYY